MEQIRIIGRRKYKRVRVDGNLCNKCDMYFYGPNYYNRCLLNLCNIKTFCIGSGESYIYKEINNAHV